MQEYIVQRGPLMHLGKNSGVCIIHGFITIATFMQQMFVQTGNLRLAIRIWLLPSRWRFGTYINKNGSERDFDFQIL